MEELPLPALFEQARKIHDAATESGTTDQDAVKKGCEALNKCEEMISKLGLFSPNESKDDISTTYLKYILVPFFLAELTEQIVQDDRIQVLKAAIAKLKEFITFCEQMDLVPEEELKTSANTAADRRELKVARFRRQRSAEAKLLEIKEGKEHRGRSSKASALSTPVEAGEEDLLDDDGEEEREAWLTTITLAISKAFDLLEMLAKEKEMLCAVKDRQLKVSDATSTMEPRRTRSSMLAQVWEEMRHEEKEEHCLGAQGRWSVCLQVWSRAPSPHTPFKTHTLEMPT